MAVETSIATLGSRAPRRAPGRPCARHGISARGEPLLWMLGGALALGILMILGLLAARVWNGAVDVLARPIELVQLADGTVIAGEPTPHRELPAAGGPARRLPPEARAAIAAAGGFAERTLYRIGNYDLYNEDFRWVPAFEVAVPPRPPGRPAAHRARWSGGRSSAASRA